MTLHGVRPGVVAVRDGTGATIATIEHRSGRACLDCRTGGYWIIAGRQGHHHRAVHAFREVVMGNVV